MIYYKININTVLICQEQFLQKLTDKEAFETALPETMKRARSLRHCACIRLSNETKRCSKNVTNNDICFINKLYLTKLS